MPPPPEPLEIEPHANAWVARFPPLAALNQPTLDHFRTQLEQLTATPGPRRQILDLSRMTSVSSAFLGWLVITASRLEVRGVDLRLAGLSPAVRQVFEVTRLTPRFQIVSDTHTALSDPTQEVLPPDAQDRRQP